MKIHLRKTQMYALCLAGYFIAPPLNLAFPDSTQPSQTKAATAVFPSVIENGRRPAHPEGVEWKVSFREDLTIGVKEGDENYMFGSRFLYFNVDDDGNIYAVDWDKKKIQKYGPDGKYLLTIGRHGQGPGEFGNIWVPHFDKDRHLYVRDIVNHKVSFFDLNGNLAKEVKMPLKAGDIQVNSRDEYVGSVSEEKDDPKSGVRVIYSHGLFDKSFNPLAVFQQTTWTPPCLLGTRPGIGRQISR